MDTLLAAGAQGAFSNRPSTVFGIERDAKTPKSYNYSVGVQRELGWGTVVDVTYAGFQMRNARDGRPTSTRCPTAPGSSTSTRRTAIRRTRTPRSRTSSCVRTWATRTSPSARTSAPAHYNSLQVQLNRRYIRGLQFAVAYTLAKTISDGHEPSTPLRPGKAWNEGPDRLDPVAQPRRQLHLGRAEREPAVEQPADARAARRLAGLRRHRVRERRLVRRQQLHHDRQLRLHRRRRRHAGEDQRRRDLHQRQLRSRRPADAGQLPQRRGVQPSDRTRRHRQRAA